MTKKYSVTEMFYTMQGEGIMAGRRSVFLRLHFCDGDSRGNLCSWCDSKFTWDRSHPDFGKYERLTAPEILSKVHNLFGLMDPKPHVSHGWITLTGGNPVMQMDGGLVKTLSAYYDLQVETQATIWKECLNLCDAIVISPKPPSSGLNDVTQDPSWAENWLNKTRRSILSVKVVVFNDEDFEWASDLYERVETHDYPNIPFYLSAGTAQEGNVTDVVLDRYRWLVEKWLKSGKMKDAICLPQMHVLVWGRRKGV